MEYLNDVEANSKYYSPDIIAQCEIQREMLKKFDFVEEKGKHCVDWIEKHCILIEGENAGQPVKLLLFQKWIIYSILCFYGNIDVEDFDDNGNMIGTVKKYVRIVNDVLLMFASGNAKTSLLAFLNLYFMFHNDIPSPKIYIGSNAYKQSRLCFDTTMKLIKRSKTLSNYANIRASIGEIEIEDNNAKLIAMSSDGTNFEGIIPAVLIIDEIHGMRTSKYADDLRKSTKRSDALTIEATTDGTVRGGYLDGRKELAHALLYGNSEVKDYRKFFAIYRQESYEEIIDAYYKGDIGIFKKSNPALGKAVSVELLKGKVVDMINDPSKKVSILTKNFNIPQNPITSYFTERECRAKEFNESIFYNAPVFLGLDMAYLRNPSNDLACLEMMVYNPYTDEEYCKDFYFIPKYWEEEVKEDGEVKIVRRDMLKAKSKEDANILYNPRSNKYGYELYAKKGDVVVINEELVEEMVGEFGEQARCDCTGVTEDFIIYYIAHLELKYNWVICKFGLDPNKASKIEAFCNQNIPSLDGKQPVIKFRMEDKKTSQPIIQTTKDVRSRGVVYNNNRLSELHFASAQAKEDQYGNITFTNSMRERKDGVIANMSARSACNVFIHNKDTGEANLEFLKGWWDGEKAGD
jgi:phage terminase large subunit-like protein